MASFPVEWLSPRLLVLVGPSNDAADWLLDTSFKASRDIWFSRDVVFTYGPVFQWLSSAPARWMGVSMGASYVSYATLPLWCTILCGYLTPEAATAQPPTLEALLAAFVACSFLGSLGRAFRRRHLSLGGILPGLVWPTAAAPLAGPCLALSQRCFAPLPSSTPPTPAPM
jgi:hypothetical protein